MITCWSLMEGSHRIDEIRTDYLFCGTVLQ